MDFNVNPAAVKVTVFNRPFIIKSVINAQSDINFRVGSACTVSFESLSMVSYPVSLMMEMIFYTRQKHTYFVSQQRYLLDGSTMVVMTKNPFLVLILHNREVIINQVCELGFVFLFNKDIRGFKFSSKKKKPSSDKFPSKELLVALKTGYQRTINNELTDYFSDPKEPNELFFKKCLISHLDNNEIREVYISYKHKTAEFKLYNEESSKDVDYYLHQASRDFTRFLTPDNAALPFPNHAIHRMQLFHDQLNHHHFTFEAYNGIEFLQVAHFRFIQGDNNVLLCEYCLKDNQKNTRSMVEFIDWTSDEQAVVYLRNGDFNYFFIVIRADAQIMPTLGDIFGLVSGKKAQFFSRSIIRCGLHYDGLYFTGNGESIFIQSRNLIQYRASHWLNIFQKGQFYVVVFTLVDVDGKICGFISITLNDQDFEVFSYWNLLTYVQLEKIGQFIGNNQRSHFSKFDVIQVENCKVHRNNSDSENNFVQFYKRVDQKGFEMHIFNENVKGLFEIVKLSDVTVEHSGFDSLVVESKEKDITVTVSLKFLDFFASKYSGPVKIEGAVQLSEANFKK